MLAALFGIPIKSFIGAIIELSGNGVPLVLIVLEPNSQKGYSMICSSRVASSADHFGDFWVCLCRERLWY